MFGIGQILSPQPKYLTFPNGSNPTETVVYRGAHFTSTPPQRLTSPPLKSGGFLHLGARSLSLSMKIPAWEQLFGLLARMVRRRFGAAPAWSLWLVGAAIFGVDECGVASNCHTSSIRSARRWKTGPSRSPCWSSLPKTSRTARSRIPGKTRLLS